MYPHFIKPARIVGNNLILRNAASSDAAFVLELRTNELRSMHLSKTPICIDRQIAWLDSYRNDNDQVYLIIQDRESQAVGTARLYDKNGESFCWGSWILKEGTPSYYAIESALLIYQFGLSLGFKRSHFDVRKANLSVWRFHERFGAVRTGETDEDYLYSISMEAILAALTKYKKYLPSGCAIEF